MRIVLDWSHVGAWKGQMESELLEHWRQAILQLQEQHEVRVLLQGTNSHIAKEQILFFETCLPKQAIRVWYGLVVSDSGCSEDDVLHVNSVLHQQAIQSLRAEKIYEVTASTLCRPPTAWEEVLSDIAPRQAVQTTVGQKPTLAMVSPLLPMRTGIAHYTSRLLPLLAQQYEIVVVVEQEYVSDPWVRKHAQVKNSQWLLDHGHDVDRVVYQMGNSGLHAYMWPLMRAIPGVVVLHDFYLGGWVQNFELEQGLAGVWEKALYDSHGYGALNYLFKHEAAAPYQYPVNWDCLRFSRGVISHSNYSKQLADQWYGADITQNWAIIPLLCQENTGLDRRAARMQLGLKDSDFLVCSFGFLGQTKLNHRLLASWLESRLASDPHCYLIFVGQNNPEQYGAELLDTIQNSGYADRIRITGFASDSDYQNYLAAADTVVQLRSLSRGESSGTVLDGMASGLAVVVNANGAFAELSDQAVWKLPDVFSNEELIHALETLYADVACRVRLGEQALLEIQNQHNPHHCAQLYYQSIEQFYQPALGYDVAQKVGKELPAQMGAGGMAAMASVLAATYPLPTQRRRLLIDLTATLSHDLKTGIERVVRALSLALLNESYHADFRLEPVYLCQHEGRWQYRYARRHTLPLVDPHRTYPLLQDEVVEFGAGDRLLGMDLSGQVMEQAYQQGLFARLQLMGVEIHWMLYDLLPIQMPHVFPPGADQNHNRWLECVATLDGVIAISKTVADEFAEWRLQQSHLTLTPSYTIHWTHLGADISNSEPSLGMPRQADYLLRKIRSKPTFLMVGTIEPRKGHLQVLQAMSLLWRKGIEVNLVVVGREGWQGLEPSLRRNIPETIDSLSQLKRNLYWFNDASDEFVEHLYQSSSALIAASWGEGFGLPLIEAAQHQLPIIARDLPVFHEVAGEHAFFFHADTAAELAQALERWLEQRAPVSVDMPWQTWQQTAQRVVMQLGLAKSESMS